MGAWLTLLKPGIQIGKWAVLVLLIAYFGGTVRQAVAWRTAGELARSSVLSLQNAPADQPLLLLSVPDHFHGAYVWRAGFHEGIALLLPERAQQPIFVASRFTMRLRTDVAVRYVDVVATLSSPDDIFLPPQDTRTPSGDKPVVLPHQLVIHRSLIQTHRLVGFERGQFVPAPLPAPDLARAHTPRSCNSPYRKGVSLRRYTRAHLRKGIGK
ncbi:MAG: hypothetical protein ACP5RN_04265 [Armatimonadota bacterium]